MAKRRHTARSIAAKGEKTYKKLVQNLTNEERGVGKKSKGSLKPHKKK